LTRAVAGLGVLVVVVAATPTVASARPDERAAPVPAAEPAQPRWGEFVEATDTVLRLTQPDGTELRARMTEAEIGGALEVDGYSIVKGSDGWWRYASGRGPEGLEASALRVGVDQRTADLRPGVGRIAPVWSDGQGGDVRTQLLRQLQAASRQASLEAAAGGGPRVFRFPVVLFATWWDKEEGQTGPQFQEGNDVAHYEAILDGFGGNPTGTLTEFYFENSHGQFLVEVDVLAQPDGSPYVSTRSMEDKPDDIPTGEADGPCFYGGIDPPENVADDTDPLDSVIGAGGGGALGMAIELFNSTSLPLDHQFADYDNDGDGSIDFMGIIHSGAEMAVTGHPCNTWSHAISVSTFTTIVPSLLADQGLDLGPVLAEAGLDNLRAGLPVPGQAVTYDRLFTMPEFETKNGILTIGVAAHEMAHALGEPDYYGTDGSTSGSGDWDVMSGGSYGGTPSGSNPTWFNPASRVFQGWVTPTVIHEDELGYTLERRSKMPADGYTVGQANPNLVLVPTRWVAVGEETSDGHVWTQNDVYGLVEDGVRECDCAQDGDPQFVVEGWYLELASRMPVKSPAIHADMTRESYFDRWLYGSGLLTWHFDYWRRSNVLFGDNGANNDPNRMQMDVEEWDFNDNTQEIALNENRAEASDVAWDAATGITSGTHRPNPKVVEVDGDPQEPIEGSVAGVTPVTPQDFEFTVDDNPANRTMRVVATPTAGDCTLQLLREVDGTFVEQTEVVDAGFVQSPETAIVTFPEPGQWLARVGDFAACLGADIEVTFEGQGDFDATGTADTWQNESQEPTGWAFTNIRTGGAEGLSHGTDAGGDDTLTLDIVNLLGRSDVSPGFVRPVEGVTDGRVPIVAGEDNELEVRVFNNGSDPEQDVAVAIHAGSPSGPVVDSGAVDIDGFDSAVFDFTFDPGQEGQLDLYAVVDPSDDIDEVIEDNNTQGSTLWAGPPDPAVLIVDDDSYGDTEQAYAGALAALGIPYAIAEKHVSAEEMSGYDAVIWVNTLDRYAGPLDEDDRAEIAAYLDDGGQLWLSSNRAIEALGLSEGAEFGAQYFGVTSADIDSFYDVVQFEMAGFLPDGTVDLDVLAGRPFVDKYDVAGDEEGETEPLGTVTSLGVLQGSGTAAAPGDGEAILAVHLDGDGFQTVTNSFSLSQVREPGDAIDIVESVMDQFEVAGGQYEVASDDPIVYHWQPRQTVANVELPVKAIVLGGDEGGGVVQPVTLFYRHHSIGEYEALAMSASGGRGGYLRLIPAVDVTPDGVDYFLKAGRASTFEPTTAEGGSVVNAVAVYLPDAAAPPSSPPAPPVPPASPAPPGDGGAGGSGRGRLPATGGAVLTGLGVALLLGGLGVRRALHGWRS
jgi:M6 family metalloprotease-like protein